MFSYLCTLTTWHCPHSSAARTAAAIDRYLAAVAHAGTDRQTDGQTHARQLYRPRSAYCAGSGDKIVAFMILTDP